MLEWIHATVNNKRMIVMPREVPKLALIIAGLFNFPRVALNSFLGIFSPFEEALLEKLCERLPEDYAHTIRIQLKEINLVKRVTARTSEINLYRISGLTASRERSEYLPSDEESYVLASMTFEIESVVVKVKFFVVRGNIFSLDFDKDISRYRKLNDLRVRSFLLEGVGSLRGR